MITRLHILTVSDISPLAMQNAATRGLGRARLFDARQTTARLADLLDGIAGGRMRA
jgi:hypothetical protein